ncbi:Dynein heavy chain domain-containing protein 1 [Bagarius yarrelli]|uniref:Dynein heavy chain domain-containing protein 1 n=1 Tax=Bagarius yarrelli TaxID=175774 RepID=A0A556V831_BAGYA|nr:Dynein heavy chain domain-containing protein 1 [Bagarius yarrelli]
MALAICNDIEPFSVAPATGATRKEVFADNQQLQGSLIGVCSNEIVVPEHVQVVLGKNATLNCKYTLFGTSISEKYINRVHYLNLKSVEDASIMREEVGFADIGSYICKVVTFPLGNWQVSTVVDIMGPDPLVDSNAESVVATCMAEKACPPADVFWEAEIYGLSEQIIQDEPDGTTSTQVRYIWAPSSHAPNHALTCVVRHPALAMDLRIPLHMQMPAGVKMTNSSLVFTHALQRNYSGKYRCEVQNKVGFHSQEVNIWVHDVDAMDIIIDHHLIGVLGEDIYLQCLYSGTHKITDSSWKRLDSRNRAKVMAGYRSGKPFAKDSFSTPESTTNLTVKVRLNSLELEGNYTCVFSSDEDEIMDRMFLRIIARPQVITYVEEEVLDGIYYQNIFCLASYAKPSASLHWDINGAPPSEDIFSIHNIKSTLPNATASIISILRFPIHLNNESSVACVIQHQALTEPSITVIKLQTFVFPNVSMQVTLIEKEEQAFFEVLCKAKGGKPHPSIMWIQPESGDTSCSANVTTFDLISSSHCFLLDSSEGNNITCIFGYPNRTATERTITLPTYHFTSLQLTNSSIRVNHLNNSDVLMLEEEDRDIKITMEVLGNFPRYRINCTKDGKPLLEDVNVVISGLMIKGPVGANHAGQYHCQAFYYRHTATLQFEIKVKPRIQVSVPIHLALLTNTTWVNGIEYTEIKCVANNVPPGANITWDTEDCRGGISASKPSNVVSERQEEQCTVWNIARLPVYFYAGCTIICLVHHAGLETLVRKSIHIPLIVISSIEVLNKTILLHGSHGQHTDVHSVALKEHISNQRIIFKVNGNASQCNIKCFRPYDLHVVPCSKAGPDHYIFSPTSVIHREQKNQGSLFQAELTFGVDGQLVLCPSMQLFQELLLQALPSVVDSILQEALLEIQQLCKSHYWLVDAYLSASKWSIASVERIRGWPAMKYNEHIQMIQSWISKVHHVPTALATSNKLVTINCSHIQEMLEPLLKNMEKDVFNVLSEELQLCAKNLTSDLKKSMELLNLQPTGLIEFANYFSMVKGYTETVMHQKLKNLSALQKTIELNFGNLTLEEVTLIEEVGSLPFTLWNQFVSLLRSAKERVMQQLSSMINTLDNTFFSLTKQLEDLVYSATTGPYLDLNQNSVLLVTELRMKYRQLHMISAQLNELSWINQILKGKPLDLSFVIAAKQNMKARKELWELIDISTAQIQEWRLLLFSQFVPCQAQDKLIEWLYQTNSIAKFIPSSDEVLQETLCVIEKFGQKLSVIVKLSSHAIKHKHWANILEEVGLPVELGQNVTMGDLMSKELWKHRNEINKICNGAKAEADMAQAFQRLQQSWEETAFTLTKFIPNVYQKKNPQTAETQQIKPPNFELTQTDSQQNSYGRGTFTIMYLESLVAQAEDSVMTLSSMLMSPHVCDFKWDVEIWLQLLQELAELLDFCKRYQQKWIFLCRMFNEISISTKNRDLIEKFYPVDQMFCQLIQAILSDPHVLNFVRLKKTKETNFDFYGQHLRIILIKGLTAMEDICGQLSYLLETPRCEFPRLYFLSDEEVIELLSMHLTPSCLLPYVRKCFRGIQWIEVDINSENRMTNQNSEPNLTSTQMWINSVYGTQKEHVPFGCPLKYNLNPVVCLDHLEKKIHQTVKELILKCIVARQCYEPNDYNPEQTKNVNDNMPTPDYGSIFIASAKDQENTQYAITSSFIKLISKYPLQCLLVAEEIQWYREICEVFLNQAQNRWICIKTKNMAKLQNLCKAVKYIIADSCTDSLATQRIVTSLRAIILLTMKHSQQISELVDIKGSLESSFEWQRLIKYRHYGFLNNWSNVGKDNSRNSEDSVYVDVLRTQVAYGNEYIGPENWMMVNTASTERAHLGILLALTSFKCAFISGPLMSGKQRTALQLGWALGQQVITLSCGSNTSFPVVCQMLLGALQSGAWLVLSSVDLLEQKILSILGQCLTDIHQCLSIILQQRKFQDHNEMVVPSGIVGQYLKIDSKNINEIKCQVLSEEKTILAKPNYGCILISINGYSAEIPENLRITLRPVSMMQPDSGIIAEVLLTSLGFSEAGTISRRLISLFSLCKDLFCLPEYVCRDECSWLVLLRKVIDTAGIYLHKKTEEADEERETDLSLKANKNTLQDYHLSPHKLSSKPFMSNAIREEQALIKSVMSVLLSTISDHNRAFQFCTIFEEIFPATKYCTTFQYIIEESERNALINAVTDDLQHTPICADSEILHNVLSLHQALKFSTAVVIFGPAGSGKTTVYRALARALRQLAEVSVKINVANANILTHSFWCSVDTIVLFPNVLSHAELFGACCEKGFWRDGAFTKVLSNTEWHECFVHSLPQIKQKVRVQKWIVLDGEPCPSWFDTLSTLGNLENPFLCLSSGKKINLSQEGIKILVETTSLREATPSALGRCSLVCISGINVWKNVWKSEIDALYREHIVDQNTLQTWKFLAEDLFSSTLIFLRHKGLTSVMDKEGFKARKTSPAITNGLQEVMSFIKILRALLWDSKKRNASKQKRDYMPKPPSTELHARNLFVIAYIWGFGGQLHPRHWLQFDNFAREALFKCRYKIEVPDKGTVFEHFFDISDKMLEDATCIRKTSGTLDTLRQCISRDKVNTSDGYHFKHFSSKAVCYLSTCRIPEEQKSVCSQISPRLSRLFTILVLPVMTADILFSIHSSQLQQWLKNFSPMPRLADMAHCIVLATFDVYLAVHRHFSSSAHSLYIVFSLHDLQKVFQGMCLFDPRTTVQIVQQRYLPSPSLLALEPDFLGAERNILTIARLWMHECLRTFGDRLSLNKDRQKLVSFLLQASEKNFCSKFKVESQILGEMPDAGCQLQSTAIADKNQHRHTTMQKDNDQSIATREESATPHKVVASEEKSNMTESKCSEELISSSFVACVKTHTVSIQPQRLLLDVSSSIHDIVFSPEFSRLHICRAQKQLNHNILYQERDLDVLIEQLNNIVKCKDAKKNYCKQAKFAVYPQRVRQLLHILRALLIPNGHVVLFSAAKKTGRKTTVRLAAYLTGYQLIEVHCGNEVKLKELLKEARRQIDMHGEHVIFMVHENTSQATRDELLLIMETWHILDEELKELRPHISAVVKNSPDQRISQVNKRYFRSKQRHVHVFLLMPHSQNNQEKATKWSSVISHHIAKALTLCCCVEIYHPWSTEALVEVASVYLKDIVDYSALVASIAQAMAAIHQSATKYATTYLKTVQPFSPQTFIELIEYFSHLCVHLNDQVKTHANRMETVLAHIKDLKDTAQGYTREACRLKVKFQRTQKELSQLQMDMDAKVTVCEETHQRCLLEERQLSLLQEQLDLAEQQAKDVLKEVRELQFFDHSKLSNELFEELGQIIRSPNFQTDIVCGVSSACESLCSWVRAVYQYACVKRSMAPHKAHKDCLTNCMSEIRERLHIARLHEEAAQEELEVVKQQQQLVRNTLKELSAQLHKVKIQEKVAAVTVEQLSNLSEKWNMVKKETEMNKHTIPGDALLIAAAIAYLGPFGPDIRLDLLKKWHKMCLTGKIKISPEDIRLSLFDEPQFPSDDNTPFANIPVAVELQKALSQALRKNQHHGQTVSPNYVLKLLLWGHKATWVHKWALLTDTQQHKDRHSCTMLIGLKVLVTEIESVAPREDFLSMLDRPDVTDHIFAAFNPNTKPHPEFCLFLSTALPAKSLAEEIHPLILEKVKVIDLSLSTSEVRSIILSDLTQSECSELWLKHFQLQQDKQILLNKLQIEEVSLVDYILQTSSPLLQDPEFLSYVRLCQISSLRLQEDIEKLSNEMDSHKPTINYFDCIAALATALFKALQNVESLYPFYFFPLCNFLTALRETLAQKGWLNVPCSAETEKGLVMSDILHRIVSHIFAYYRQSLFQSHAELLRLFFSVALFMHTEESSELECTVFLRGFNNIETAEYAFSPEQSALVLPSWIPTHAKPVLNLLEKIPPFHNLISSLRNSSRLWQEYFHFPSATVVGPVPCQSHSQLTTLQRAILWKTFYPEWLAAVVDDLFACQLGQNLQSAVADSLQTSSLEAFSSFLSRNKGPIIVTMPGQIENESRSIHPVYWIKHFALHHMQLEGVKVVMLSFGSKCQNDYLLSALNTAVQTGNWLVLNNCHLLDHWDSKFITQLRQWTKKAFIRMCATHLVFDSQWDLKDELCASFRHVTSTVIPAANTVDPIPRAAILHSVLMQRQKVKHLGHGKIYKWSYEDLLALTEAHVGIAKLCHDPVQALEYIADEDILKDVQNCIETTLNSNDSLLLGFSAEMKNDIVKIRSDTLRNLLQCEFSLGSIGHNDSIYLLELTDYKMAHKRLQILQTKIEQTKSQGGCRGKVSMGPICSFLQTEWENLVETVSSLLKNVYQQPQVLAASPNITSIILELETRANLLQMYQMKESNSSYCVYCLSAFANPHGFLAALIRETVQTKHSDISQVALHYQVQILI